MYFLFCVILCLIYVYMCTVLLPPGGYPIAVKYSYIISSGLPKNKSNVSKFIVHSVRFWDPRMHYKFWYIGSVLWKAWWRLNRVETCCHKNILYNKLLCSTEICTLYELDKHIRMTNVKLNVVISSICDLF